MKIFVVVEGGCVRYVSSEMDSLDVHVIDLDDLMDDPDPDRQALLDEADALPCIW